ncbi:hypothetical protein QLQ15_13875 [Lysobacter sp. LF1]|uniref:Uncharacterized protein n=1 Tax=Lysobacter stagni TaxID=3045172 RepID=A0ABT6XIL0_9GAMM|nr:hypothetical protein [Lysobacter sp. LF1]MDI9239997.1 hypothetical protein [Lysobacter sp. LF1]
MSLLLELLEHVLDWVTSWRLYVAWALTAFLVWLVLEFGPQDTRGTVLAVAIATVGIVGGWRWARSEEAR